MNPSTYTLDSVRSTEVVATWALASDSTRPYAYAGKDHAAGLLSTLYGAELLAVQAGAVKPSTLNGVQVVVVGQARDAIKSFSDPAVRTLYLASYGAVRMLNDTAVPRQPTTPYGLAPPTGDSLPIVVPIVIAIVAIAGVVAGAWYMTSTKNTEIEVQGHNLRQAQLANSYTAMGLAAMKAGQPVPPQVWQGLTDLAAQEADHNAWVVPTLTIAGGVAAGLGGWWWWKNRGRRR